MDLQKSDKFVGSLWILKINPIMRCIYCQHPTTRVVDKRDTEEGNATRRRRQCEKCGKRFTTYERIEQIQLKVVKKDGRLQDYDRGKIKRGLMRAIGKRPVSEEQIEELIDDIEQRLLNRQSTEISTSDIGRMVLTRLKKLDKVAYMRFASVFLEFKDLDDFKREIREL